MRDMRGEDQCVPATTFWFFRGEHLLQRRPAPPSTIARNETILAATCYHISDRTLKAGRA
jgi:hypothetical protein